MNRYGECSNCGSKLSAIMFEQKETIVQNSNLIYTGRKRMAVDYLICNNCLKKECVDDSFDGSWYN